MQQNIDSIEKYRKRKKRAGSIRWILYLLFFILCLVGGFSFAISPFFNIENIEVSGYNKATEAEILALSNISVGQPIYKANIKQASVMIATNIWIESAKVERKLPDTIIITVKERTAAAYVQTATGLLQVDINGYVLQKQNLVQGLHYMLITGADDLPSDILTGSKLESEKVAAGLWVIDQMDQASASVISEIDVSNIHKIKVYTVYNIDLILGDQYDFRNKFDIFSRIMNSDTVTSKLDKVQYIDVSVEEKAAIGYKE